MSFFDPYVLYWLMIVFIFSGVLINTAAQLKNFESFINAKTIKGKIIGYKWYKQRFSIKNLTRFWPILKYSEGNHEKTIIAKGLNVLLPENTEIKVKFDESRFKYSDPAYILFPSQMLFIATTFCFIVAPDYSLIFFHLFLVTSAVTLLTFAIYTYSMYGNLKNMFWILFLKKPKNSKKITAEESKAIEQKDIVSYEEALLHYLKFSNRHSITTLILVLLFASLTIFLSF